MNPVPARRRRSVVSLVLGALAMSGSFAALGAVILSDVAAAEATARPAQAQVAQVKQDETVTPSAQAPAENSPLTPPEKPVAKKRVRKHAKVDFGRFEGY